MPDECLETSLVGSHGPADEEGLQATQRRRFPHTDRGGAGGGRSLLGAAVMPPLFVLALSCSYIVTSAKEQSVQRLGICSHAALGGTFSPADEPLRKSNAGQEDKLGLCAEPTAPQNA